MGSSCDFAVAIHFEVQNLMNERGLRSHAGRQSRSRRGRNIHLYLSGERNDPTLATSLIWLFDYPEPTLHINLFKRARKLDATGTTLGSWARLHRPVGHCHHGQLVSQQHRVCTAIGLRLGRYLSQSIQLCGTNSNQHSWSG